MKKLAGPLDVDFINRTFWPEYQDVSVINEGECFIWAYIAYHLYEDVELWSFGNHAFVKYHGKFYDSERPNGEDEWEDLPATNFGKGCGCWSCTKPARKVTPNLFKDDKHWGKQTKRFNVTWGRLRELVRKVVEGHEGQVGNDFNWIGPALVQSAV
jgi:3'-phosphoadenosine 5'-phosphosulfate sulfotransferase (PAPS reductase)/FAD synthetase